MELTTAVCVLLQETAKAFRGARRRRFLAETVEAFGLSQRQAERQLGWNRDTIRKAQHEMHSGITCIDNFSARGRKPAEFHLPHLFRDLSELVRDQLQTDPTFQTTGLYCRLSAAEVRNQLIKLKGYKDQELPSVQTVGDKLNLLGFRLRTVVKSRPQKKSRKPTPSSKMSRRFTSRPPLRKTPYGCRWMPKPRSSSVPSRGAAKAVGAPGLPTTISSRGES